MQPVTNRWSVEKVLEAMPKIRRLRAVKNAWYENGYLHVETRAWTLKHPYKLSYLPEIEFRLYCGQNPTKPYMRYVEGWVSKVCSPHPSLDKGIGTSYFKTRCLGHAYENELYNTWQQGPFDVVLGVLGMIQTISRDDRMDFEFMLMRLVSWFAIGAMILIFITHHLIK